MPGSTTDNLGRRRFLLHRNKAVEDAIERVRRSPGAQWESLSADEREGLKIALTEIWDSCGRERWEQYCFSSLTRVDLLALIALIDRVKQRHAPATEKRTEIEAILLSCNRDMAPH